MIFLYVSYTLNILRRSHRARASNVLPVISLLFYSYYITRRRILKLELQVGIWTNWTWKCHFIYPTKALCLYSPLFSNPHWVKQWTLRSSHQGEIKQGVSQWHSESDNGTIEFLSITALSLEKSSQKGVSLVTLSHVCLFILTFKSVFL